MGRRRQVLDELLKMHEGLSTKKITELDTDQDEKDTAKYLNQLEGEYNTMDDPFARWDVEGLSSTGKTVKVEVRSRTRNKAEEDTWLVDSYKMDYLLETFPDDLNFFVNVYKNAYYLYDVNFVAQHEIITTRCKMPSSGKWEDREVYYFPKKQYIMELRTGKQGPQYEKFKDELIPRN